VKKAQDGVLEFLLINHPLDCPVCDRGGECPLQDQTFAFGPGESRFVEEKRHFEKPIPISDLVALDRERCILCARCTRFADEVAGDPLISFNERGNETQVLTFPDDPFASYFSGNTVQICPVGALTATPYRFRARPWDLEQVESTCTTCAVGCRIAAVPEVVLDGVTGLLSDPRDPGALAGLIYVASDLHSDIPLIGASGAIAGVVVAYVMLRPCARVTVLVTIIPLRLSAYWVIGAFALMQIINLDSASRSEVAYWCHVGGMVAGALLLLLLRPAGVKLFDCMRPQRLPDAAMPDTSRLPGADIDRASGRH